MSLRRCRSGQTQPSARSNPLALGSSVGFSAPFRNLYPRKGVRAVAVMLGVMQAGWPQRSSFSNAHPQEPLFGNLVQSVKVLFVQRRREKITTDRHFADGECEVACQSSLRHVAASADRKRRRNVLRFFMDGQE